MSNIVKCSVSIKGIKPLHQHMFGEFALPLTPGEKTGVAGNDPEEWKRTCMVAENGQLYIMGKYIYALFKNAARYTKKGRGSIQPMVAATLTVDEDVVLLDRFMPPGSWPLEPVGKCSVSRDSKEPVYIDVCGVKNPSTGARNIRYRLTCSPGWTAKFTLQFDKTLVSRPQMQAVANDAGMLVGLADGRGIGAGRFIVESFEEVDA